jgi:hypothetical protein
MQALALAMAPMAASRPGAIVIAIGFLFPQSDLAAADRSVLQPGASGTRFMNRSTVGRGELDVGGRSGLT